MTTWQNAASSPRLGAELRATLRLAWPLVLTNVAQTALGTTDIILMGRFSPDALAAGVLGWTLYFALVIFGVGVVTATSPMIAIELGRNRHSVRDVRRSVRQGFWVAVSAFVPMAIILWNGEAVFGLLGQTPELSAAAASYLQTLMWAGLPFMLYVVLRNFVSALQRPLASLTVALLAIPVNAVLVWALMFGNLGFPAFGLAGAGIGTSVTNVLLVAGLAIFISTDRRFRRYRLFGRFWRPDWPRFVEIWRIGLPIALAIVFEVWIFNAAAFLMGLIGKEELAAHAVAIQAASMAFMVPLGIGMAVTVRVGLAYGRRDQAGAGLAGWTSYALAVGYALVTAMAFIFAGRPIVGVFLDLGDPANAGVVDLAVLYLAFAGLFQLFDSCQATAIGALRGLSDTRTPMILAGIGYWGVGLPLGIVLAFPLGLDGVGVWIGLAAGLAVVAFMLTGRWMLRGRLGLFEGGRLRGLEAGVGASAA